MAERACLRTSAAAILVLCLAALLPARTVAHDGWGGALHLLDAVHVERAVSGAERLAKMADPPEVGAGEGRSDGLVARILNAVEGGPAAESLADAGYAEPDLALGLWTEEFTQVIAAYRALVTDPPPRPAHEVAAEIERLPIVPLDEAGARERAALMRELAVASVPPADREAVAPFVPRIRTLEARLDAGAGQ